MPINPFRNKKIKQASVLYISSIGAMFLGFLISVINTRYLGKVGYGDFKFIEVLFSFSLLFSTLGFFNTSTYLIAREENSTERKKIIGASLLLVLIASFILALLLIIYTLFFYDGHLKSYILPLVLFVPVVILNFSLEHLLQGLNKIYLLSILKIGPKIIFFVALLLLTFLDFSLVNVLLLFYGSITLIVLSILLKVKFIIDLKALRQILRHNRKVGFPIFIGALFGVATGHLSSLLVSHFNDNTDFGYFILSLTISAPIGVMPTITGSIMMKDFVDLKRIPSKTIKTCFYVSIIILICFLVFLKPFVLFFYTEQYTPVISLAYITSFGFLMHGFGDLFIKFLYAKGHGKEMKHATMGVGIVTLIVSICLIPSLGPEGASIVKVISSFSYLSFAYFYYKKIIKSSF